MKQITVKFWVLRVGVVVYIQDDVVKVQGNAGERLSIVASDHHYLLVVLSFLRVFAVKVHSQRELSISCSRIVINDQIRIICSVKFRKFILIKIHVIQLIVSFQFILPLQEEIDVFLNDLLNVDLLFLRSFRIEKIPVTFLWERFLWHFLFFVMVHTLRVSLPYEPWLWVGKLVNLHILIKIVFELNP